VKSKIFSFSKEEPEETFIKFGYRSESSVENIGSMFVYLGGFFGLVVLALLLRFLKNKYELVNKLYTFLANLIFWNMFLRMFLEGYIEYSITSIMNLYKTRWESRSDIFSSIFSITIFAWIFLFPFLVWILLWKNFNNLKD
jgi:hypothetical protein